MFVRSDSHAGVGRGFRTLLLCRLLPESINLGRFFINPACLDRADVVAFLDPGAGFVDIVELDC